MLSIRNRLGALGLSLALAAAALGARPVPAAAQTAPTAEELVLKLQLCRSLRNRAFRLNCFDGLARALPRQLEDLPVARAPEPAGVPVPPARPGGPFDLAGDQVPEMAEAGRKTAVAIAGPSGTDWDLAPSPRAQVATSPARQTRQLVDSRPIERPAPPDAEPEATAGNGSDLASLFDFTARAEAATSGAAIPLPPEPPERLDLAGLLDGGVPLEGEPPQPGDVPPSAEPRMATHIAPDGAIETASIGDAPVSPTIKRNWSVSGWTSPLSGVRDMTLTRASERLDDGPVTLLSFSCSNERGAVQVVWPRGMSAEEAKAWIVLDGVAGEAETWEVSPDGRTMSRHGRGEALASARRIAEAGEITVRIAGDPAHAWEASFGTDGLASHLSEFGAACTS